MALVRIGRRSLSALVLSGVALWCTLASSTAFALPFNQDMVGTQLSNGAIMRKQEDGTVPVGSSARFVGTTREDAKNLVNPVPPSEESIAHGARLYSANCSMCHGRFIDDETYVPGAVWKYVPGPNLVIAAQKKNPDSHYFQYIYFGGLAIMPAYGWKFSMVEHWDIVNYIRFLQDKGVMENQPGK